MTGITDALANARATVGLRAGESPEKACANTHLPAASWQQRLALVPTMESPAALETGELKLLHQWRWTVARRDADRRSFITDVFSKADRPEQAIGFKLSTPST